MRTRRGHVRRGLWHTQELLEAVPAVVQVMKDTRVVYSELTTTPLEGGRTRNREGHVQHSHTNSQLSRRALLQPSLLFIYSVITHS